MDCIHHNDECTPGIVARGMCGSHYGRWRRYGDALTPLKKHRGRDRRCGEPGCQRPHEAKGKCRRHYQRAEAGYMQRSLPAQRVYEAKPPVETPEERKKRLDAIWAEIQARRNQTPVEIKENA